MCWSSGSMSAKRSGPTRPSPATSRLETLDVGGDDGADARIIAVVLDGRRQGLRHGCDQLGAEASAVRLRSVFQPRSVVLDRKAERLGARLSERDADLAPLLRTIGIFAGVADELVDDDTEAQCFLRVELKRLGGQADGARRVLRRPGFF